MTYEKTRELEKTIRNEFKKLSKKTEETIRKEAKEKQQQTLTFKNDDKYYINQVYNPLECPEKIDVEFEIVKTGYSSNKEYEKLNDIWNWYKSHVSSLKCTSLIGRSVRILVKEKYTQKYIGMISLSDVMKLSKDRDAYIGWNNDCKYKRSSDNIKLLDYILDISTCVPLQPFGYNFNGGKLLAMLCFSKQIQDICKIHWGHNIAAFQTMGVNGKSPMYSRCNIEKGSTPFLKYVGMTAGHGVTNLIPDSLYAKCVEYLKLLSHECLTNTSMFNSKLTKLRTCMRYLNIDLDFLDTKSKKGIYVGFTSKDSQKFMQCKKDSFDDEHFISSTEICSKWLTRWGENRINNRIRFKTIRYNDTSLVTIERRDDTMKKTNLQRERRRKERETKDPEILKKKTRIQNNRTNIRKYVSRQKDMSSEKVEEILDSIPIICMQTKTCSQIIDELDKKFNFKKAEDRYYKGYYLKDGWGSIYIIKNKIDGKKYIGQVSHFRTKQKIPAGFPQRMLEHLKCIDGKVECPLLDQALKKYGWDNFDKYPILECRIENMDYFETLFIEEYESHKSTGKGYNLTWGGQDQRGYNWRTGIQHHMWGKSLSDNHKQNISKSNIVAKRHISDDIFNQILLFKHSNHTETEVIDILKKNNIEIHRGLIEKIWSGKIEPLDKNNRFENHDDIVSRKRKQPTTCRTEDVIIEDIFKLKFANMSAKEVVVLCSKKYGKTKIVEGLVNKIWCRQLKPRFPTEQYIKLSDVNRIVKKRKLDDKYIEEIYFLKAKKLKQQEVIKKIKEDHEISIKQQDVSMIWRKQLEPLIPTEKYKNAFNADNVKKPKRILTDDQREYVLSQKGVLTTPQLVDKVKELYNIDIKKSYIHDILRPKRTK